MSAIKGSIRYFLLGRPKEESVKKTPAEQLSLELHVKKQKVYELLRAYQDGEYNERCILVGCLDIALSGLYDELVKIL